ncbi:MAG: signal peptide peptidase SppA [Beijerinckiaceae bacterium]
MTSIPPDYIVDRRNLRRRLSFWRILAFSALIIAIITVGLRLTGTAGSRLIPHIARLSIEGVITGDKDTLKLVDDIGKSNASAVLLEIESPGGTTTGAERLYDALRRLAQKKPLVSVIGTVGASGGYIAALGADEIFAEGNSLVGSIGVLFQIPNVAQLLDKVGVKVEEVKSSPLKAAPNGYEPTSEAARQALNALVVDSFDWFKALVKDRRQLSDAEIANVADGRVFTGRQGIGLKLVDKLGGEREAIEWLETQKNISKNLPVQDWKKGRSLERLGIFGAAAGVAELFGFRSLAQTFERLDMAQTLRVLDGPLVIWQVDRLQ